MIKNTLFYSKNIFNFFYKIKYIFNKNIFNYKKIFNYKCNLYNILIIFIIIWFINGFHIIKEDNIGIILRCGKYNHTEYPGINWKITGVDKLNIINIKLIKELSSLFTILTIDNNLINININTQYIINNPIKYLFKVSDIKNNLKSIIEYSVKEIINKYTIYEIFEEDKNLIKNNIIRKINNTINKYDFGISVLNINYININYPKELQNVFKNLIKSKEEKKEIIKKTQEHCKQIKFKAYQKSKKMLENIEFYQKNKIFLAKSEINYLKKILLSYKLNSKITKNELYLNSIKKYFKNIKKIIINKELIDELIIIKKNNNILKNNIKNS